MKLIALAAGVAVAAFASAASAQTAPADYLSPGRFALGLGGGTTGGDVDAFYSVNRYVTVRGEGSFIDFDTDFTSSGTKYRGELRHNVGGGDLDLHPFGNPFFVSGGFVSGQRKVRVTAAPVVTATFTVSGVRQQITQAVPLEGNVDLGSTAPFAGLGFDNTFTHRGHWGFRAVAGVIFGDNPKAALTTTSPYLNDPTLGPLVQSALATYQAELQHDVDGYKYYPVVQVGVNYRF